METKIEVVSGKQGRTNANDPAYQLLDVIETIAIDSETLSSADLEPLANNIRSLAESHSGHNFDKQYMRENAGAYGIRAIALNTQLEATKCTIPLYRPTSHGGHVMFRVSDEIKRILKCTYDDIDIQQAGTQEIHLHVAKFEGLDTLFILPTTIHHPGLLERLNLEKKGDGTNTILLIHLRLCDGLGLGRSPPKLSIGKFKFLFPGEQIDVSVKKSRGGSSKRKRSSEEGEHTDEDDEEPHVGKYVCTHQETHIRDRLMKALQKQMKFYSENIGGASEREKCSMFQICMHFIRTFEAVLGRDKFNTVFGEFNFPSSYMMEILSKGDIIHYLTMAGTEGDMEAEEKIMDSVQNMRGILNEQISAFAWY